MIYCFTVRSTGQPVKISMSWEEFERIRVDADTICVDPHTLQPTEPESDGSVYADRDWGAERPGVPSDSAWPQHSWAAGVNPEQRQEAWEHSKEIGVPTRFDHNGDAVFRSRGHRKRYLERVGIFDRDAGYSDPTPDNL